MAAGGLTGILLVGGASRRFGSPKALARLDGETLAARAWRTLAALCDERIAVGKRADTVDLPFELVDDGTDLRAALAGVVAGLRASENELTVVLPVDVPLVRAADLRRLADACVDVAVPQTGPLPCAIRRTALPPLERRLAAHQLALRDAFAELETHVVELDPQHLVNVNAPADLEALQLSIVPFRAADAEGFRALVADTLREFGFSADPGLDPDLADPAGYYSALWVALIEGHVVGSIALRELGDDTLELKRMYLREACRGRGAGRRLLATALAWARANGAAKIKLDTTESMEAARALYEANGFVRVPGEAPRQGQQRLLYELTL
ncbi:MAG: GNAT family N-acetyltransferase [Actinobacteria bacterium]|nr:MAG: GNAT family N-acetyltransferase [Actinomycetota bacterium]